VKNSREKLLKYESDGYSILVNDSLIKLKQVYLDEEKIKEIELDKGLKSIVLVHKDKSLNLVPLSFIAKESEPDKLIIIDGSPIQRNEIDSSKIEMSAIKSVKVLKDDSVIHGRSFKEVIIVSTKNNER
jgi:hypothetical protein